MIIKATFDLGADGQLRPAADPFPFVLDQLKTPFGEFHGELFFKKRGVGDTPNTPQPNAWPLQARGPSRLLCRCRTLRRTRGIA